MHEVGIMESTLDIALKHAQQQGASKIHQLTMRVGAMSGVVPDALEFAFDIVVKGTIAEGARLKVDYLPLKCYCPHCRLEFQSDNQFYECPQCHRISSEIRQGKELELSSLEVS